MFSVGKYVNDLVGFRIVDCYETMASRSGFYLNGGDTSENSDLK